MAKDKKTHKALPTNVSLPGSRRMSGAQVLSHAKGKDYSLRRHGGFDMDSKSTFSSGIPSEAPANFSKKG